MSRTQLNWLLGVVLVVLLGITLAMRRDPSTPNYEFLPDMAHSIPYDAFAPNPIFSDGKTLQPPIPGTIAQDELPLYYSATPEDALRAGEELRNPYPAEDLAALQRGVTVYGEFCAPCHGGAGRGDGLVAQRGFPPPPSLYSERIMTMKDGQMFHALTYGGINMPSYAPQISSEDRWKVILNIREMQRHETTVQAAAAQEAAAQQAAAARALPSATPAQNPLPAGQPGALPQPSKAQPGVTGSGVGQ